jgi:DNA-directed RNA polymerase specialized sigma24 family protein
MLPQAVSRISTIERRMEGRTNREIAERLGCVEHTVERKLRSIRRLWSEEVDA